MIFVIIKLKIQFQMKYALESYIFHMGSDLIITQAGLLLKHHELESKLSQIPGRLLWKCI